MSKKPKTITVKPLRLTKSWRSSGYAVVDRMGNIVCDDLGGMEIIEKRAFARKYLKTRRDGGERGERLVHVVIRRDFVK